MPDEPEKSAERPLECSECKRSIAVLYTVVEQGAVTHTVMCGSCPELERRLHGTAFEQPLETGSGTQIICPNCGLALTTLRAGMPLGCAQCYDTFSEQILHEVIASNHVPSSLSHVKIGTPLHVGRSPDEAVEISPALRIQALNRALAEALQKEDYEQAAWLRDQIKQLTETPHEGEQ